jgi:hypothetical protein
LARGVYDPNSKVSGNVIRKVDVGKPTPRSEADLRMNDIAHLQSQINIPLGVEVTILTPSPAQNPTVTAPSIALDTPLVTKPADSCDQYMNAVRRIKRSLFLCPPAHELNQVTYGTSVRIL